MGIVPIPGIGLLPSAKEPQGDLRPPGIFDVDGAARPGDSERRRQERKAAGAEEDEKDDLMLDTETEPGEGSEGSSSVDYFA